MFSSSLLGNFKTKGWENLGQDLSITRIFLFKRFNMFLKIKKLRSFIFQFILLGYSFQSLANTGSGSPGKTQATPTALEQFFPFIILGLVFYFLLIRPQQRRHKRHGDFLSKIKRGDEVLTSSGIYGRIEGLTDSFVILEVAEDVRIRVVKSQISSYAGQTENNRDTGTKTK